MAEQTDTIIEEREELMISPTGDADPTLRLAHFLRPSITKSVKFLPPLPMSSIPTSSHLVKLRRQVQFKNYRGLKENWKKWVDHMHSTYHSTWKKAGIYDAIMSSKYNILPHKDLVLGVAEKWCCETNTFIFPWGEATFTLEDMMVLGGYSVLGDSVLKIGESVEIQEKLIEGSRDIHRNTGQYPRTQTWIDHFIGSGNKVEHEAFLTLWLSTSVFPSKLYNCIGKDLFPVAIRLARGEQVALAPAVLARIYRDLGSLKENIVDSNKMVNDEDRNDSMLSLLAPFQLLQLWVWERFPTLRPKPNLIESGEPRVARWHKLKGVRLQNVRQIIDAAGDSFQWRPYAATVKNLSFHKFYRENEEWAPMDSDTGKELESIVRCMRVCDLVGFDHIEQYLPHRVAMQFGLDQDVPGRVCQFNKTPEIAWSNYNRPIRDAKLYIPPRLFESDVTTRYFDWWRHQSSMSVQQDSNWGIVKRSRSLRSPPQKVQRHKEAPSAAAVEGSVDEDNLMLLEMLQSTDKHTNVEETPVSDVVKSLLGSQFPTLSPCDMTMSIAMINDEKLSMEDRKKNVQNSDEALVKEPEEPMKDGKEIKLGKRSRSLQSSPQKVKRHKEAPPAAAVEGSVDEDNLMLLEMLQSTDKHTNVEETPVSDVVTPLLGSQFPTLSPCDMTMSIAMINDEKLSMEDREKNVQNSDEALVKEPEEPMKDGKEIKLGKRSRSLQSSPQKVKRHKEAPSAAAVEGSVDEDNLMLLEMLQSIDKHTNVEETLVSDVVTPLLGSQFPTLSPCDMTMSIAMINDERLSMEDREKNVQNSDEALVKEPEEPMKDGKEIKPGKRSRSLQSSPQKVKRHKEAPSAAAVEGSVDEDNLKLLEMLQSTDKQTNLEETPVSDVVTPLLGSQFPTLSPCDMTMSTAMIKDEKFSMEDTKKNVQNSDEALAKEPVEPMKDGKEIKLEIPVFNTDTNCNYNGVSSSNGHSTIEAQGLELKARISKLEEVFAGLKAIIHRNKLENKTRRLNQI